MKRHTFFILFSCTIVFLIIFLFVYAILLGKKWYVEAFVDIFGGLSLLLFGMSFVNDSLQKFAGQKLKNVLTSLTSSKFKSLFSGFTFTIANQSSSATMLLIISLISTGIISFYQSMSISLGASLGSTITAQLIAFKFTDLAMFIIVLGYILSFTFKEKRISKIGDAIFGFGLLFLGMKFISNSISSITANSDIFDLISNINSPIIGIFAGIIITLILQSSGAVVGIVIALAVGDVISLLQAVELALGSQIGTCITVVLGSLKMPRSSKRLVIWQIIQQIFIVIVILPFLQLITINDEGLWIYFVKKITKMFIFSQDVSRQIAMSHTLSALLNCIIILPTIKIFQRFMYFIYPFKEEEISFGTVYIDAKNVEKDTDKALKLIKKEILRLGEFVLNMLESSFLAFKSKDISISEKIYQKALKIELLNKEIVPYIAKLGQKKLNKSQSQEEIRLLYILSNLSEISEIIDRNLMHIAKKKVYSYVRFSDEGLKDIQNIYNLVYSNLTKVLGSFLLEDKALAKNVASSAIDVTNLETSLKQKHIARLHANLRESIETSGLHIDIIEQYTKINSSIADIGNIISE